jgi:peptidoglycan/LPS O-acetylase OafA/YrhL
MSKPASNFVGLRLLAATLVLVGHAVTLEHSIGARISHPGLLMLFSISGYLVAGSWRSDPHIGRFLSRRFFRIWPAYAAMILICAGLAYPSRPHDAVAFLRNLWFEFYPVGINGSIWMMPIEMSLYLLLALAGTGTLLSLGVMCVFAAWMTGFFGVGWTDFGIFFVAGLLLQAYPEVRRRALIFVIPGVAAFLVGLDELGNVLVIPAAIVWVGVRSWPALRSADRLGDLSYGIFLWHAPVLHFIVEPMGLGILQNTLATIVLSAVLASASWHVIERRALRLKPTSPHSSNGGVSHAASAPVSLDVSESIRRMFSRIFSR